MANSEHWDTGTGATTEDKGLSRLHTKVSGSWERQSEVFTKVSGSWKRVNKIWTKVSDSWEPVYWAPEVGEELVYAATSVLGNGEHWSEFEPKVKYLGGNPLDLSSWSFYASFDHQGGTGGDGTFGWTTGGAGETTIPATPSSSQTALIIGDSYGWFRVGGTSPYDTGTHSAAFGSLCPVFHCRGSHSGFGRAGFDNYSELRLYNSETEWGYGTT